MTTTEKISIIFNGVLVISAVYANWKTRQSAKETAEFSRKTLEENRKDRREARENRKDDVMPVLGRAFKSDQSIDHFGNKRITLENVGQGPIFNLESDDECVEYISPDFMAEKGVVYFVSVNINRIPWEKSGEFYITYKYKDMYGRNFRVLHRISKDGESNFEFDKQLGIPEKIGI